MKLFRHKSKDFKKEGKGIKINKKKRKRIIESVEINTTFISFLKIIFFLYLIYYDKKVY